MRSDGNGVHYRPIIIVSADDTETTPFVTGSDVQHGGERESGRLTSHELVLIIGSCITCLVVMVTFFAMISIAKWVT